VLGFPSITLGQMPRLGTGIEGEARPPPRDGGGIAQAYPYRNASLMRIMIIFFIIMFLRNVLHDYRKDEMSVLEAHGLSEDEIIQYIPRTAAEQAKLRKQDMTKYTSEYTQLMMDVAMLKDQVKVLNKKSGIGDENAVGAVLPETGGGGGELVKKMTSDNEFGIVEKVEEKNTMEKMQKLESMESASMG